MRGRASLFLWLSLLLVLTSAVEYIALVDLKDKTGDVFGQLEILRIPEIGKTSETEISNQICRVIRKEAIRSPSGERLVKSVRVTGDIYAGDVQKMAAAIHEELVSALLLCIPETAPMFQLKTNFHDTKKDDLPFTAEAVVGRLHIGQDILQC